jgi:hypothetical protein
MEYSFEIRDIAQNIYIKTITLSSSELNLELNKVLGTSFLSESTNKPKSQFKSLDGKFLITLKDVKLKK